MSHLKPTLITSISIVLAIISLKTVYADELTLPFPGTEQAIAVDNNIEITTNNHKSFKEDFKEYYAQQQLRQQNLADVAVYKTSNYLLRPSFVGLLLVQYKDSPNV